LLDVNMLAAPSSDEHEFHRKAHRWFDLLANAEWALCPVTEAGFIRLAANPATRVGPGSIERASEVLAELMAVPGYPYWPISEVWADLTAPFTARIFGHQQVTDAYLLGLAIKNDGVLVTFDRSLPYPAGPGFQRNLPVLE
jgi:uncharacterized protein